MASRNSNNNPHEHGMMVNPIGSESDKLTGHERIVTCSSGYAMLLVALGLLVGAILCFIFFWPVGIPLILIFLIMLPGFFVIDPNTSAVLTLFGTYKGTVKKNGFFWTNPFYGSTKITLRARNFDSPRLKVNDKVGNPIMISVILVWRVDDTYRARFAVENYQEFVRVQTDAAVRKLAGLYPYDDWENHADYRVVLRSGAAEVNHALEKELGERLDMAGIQVTEARIAYLAYAEEIASAMLKRQQATAIIAAREKIVEGAVGMVDKALQQLSSKHICTFDDAQKSRMVSNLMVVLCADKEAGPVVDVSA